MHLRHLERRRRLPKGLRSTLPKVTLVPLVVVVDKNCCESQQSNTIESVRIDAFCRAKNTAPRRH